MPRAVELFYDDSLQRRMVQCKVGIEAFQLAVRRLQLPEPLHSRGLQAPVFGCPLVGGGSTEARGPPNRVDGATGIGRRQETDDLGFGECRLAPGNLLRRGLYLPKHSPGDVSRFQGSLQVLSSEETTHLSLCKPWKTDSRGKALHLLVINFVD